MDPINNPENQNVETQNIEPQQVEQQMPQQVQPPGRFKFNKVSIIVLILAILIAGGSYAGIWYWMKQSTNIVIPTYTPRPDATAGWKTYANYKSGYQFKYPNTWNAVTSKYNSGNALFGQGATEEQGQGGVELTGTLTSGQSLESFINNFNKGVESGSVSETESTINNQNVVISILPKAGGGLTKSVAFLHDNQVFSVYITNFDTSKKDVFDGVLPTFKFTDSTAGWKTYTNAKYGFEVKYPTDYRVDPYGQPTGKGAAAQFVLEGPEGTDLPFFSIRIFSTGLSPQAWVNTADAISITGSSANRRKSTYSVGQRTVLDSSPKELGTRVRIFSENGLIVVFEDTSDAVPLAMNSFKFIEVTGPFCGGIAGVACPTGYTCRLDGSYPDAGGVCVK